MSFVSLGFEPTDKVYHSKSGLNYTSLFFYEKKFFDDEYVNSKGEWMRANWHMSIYYATAYVVAIFLGQAYMRTRERFELRGALVAWNLFLAVFSFIGTARTWPEFINALTTQGLTHTMCSPDYTYGVFGCWGWLFIISKLPELVDTIFIVLRKQKLIFLHWYHHATVLIYCWYSAKDFSASGRWFVLMNYTVHSAMYSYYALRALRFKIPKWVNITITSGQILQMIVGIYINCVAWYQKKNGAECHVSEENITWSFIMYFSYFLLFFKFFYDAYLAEPKHTKISKSSIANGKPNGVSNGHVAKNGHLSNGYHNNHHDKKVE